LSWIKSCPKGFKREWQTTTIMLPETTYSLSRFNGLHWHLRSHYYLFGTVVKEMTNNQQKRNRLLFWLFFGMTIIPFVIAWVLKENPELVKVN